MADSIHPSLASALADLQTRLPRIAKDKTAKVTSQRTGKTHSYDYADLATVSEKILPMLGVLGLSFMAFPDTYDGKFCLRYVLQHSSGDREIGHYPLPAAGTPQEIGSAITYARRYCLCAVTGIAPDNEDDAAQAAERAAYGSPPCPVCGALIHGIDGCNHRNADGSLSRSRTTDEEKTAAGVMTTAEQKAHLKLAKPPPNTQPVERSSTAVDDRWTSDAPSWAVGVDPPEDEPGSIGPAQRSQIMAVYAALKLTTHEQRIADMNTVLGTAVESTNELSYQQAGRLLENLHERHTGKMTRR
jgi:hypothetical protein